MIKLNLDITMSVCRASIFFSELTLICHLISLSTVASQIEHLVDFSKSSSSSLVITNSLSKKFFHYITTVFTFFDHTKLWTASSLKYDLKGLLNLWSSHTDLQP